jgi:glycosyltransferase involved in cell wall biosynthesis
MYPPHHYGGYELSCRDVVDRWRARGHEVEVLTTTMRVPGVADPPAESDAGVRRELLWYWDDHVLTSPAPWRRLWHERHNRRRLRAALRRHRPDVVSVWNMGAMSLGLLDLLVRADVPVVYVVCDDWLLYGARLDAWIRAFRDRAALGRIVTTITGLPTSVPDIAADGTFCFVSDVTRQRAEEHSGWTFRRATVVYSGIDSADFPLLEPHDRPWRGRLLCVGRIDGRKGFDTAIRAVARLEQPVSLDIVGKGDEAHHRELRELVASLGVDDRVTFSTAAREELAAVFRAADAFVFPSTWTEPFGLVPLEAMACGTPVLATGVGGSGEFLVDGVNCVRFPPGDDAALADAVRRLAGDAGLRDRICRGGLATAADLTVDRLADVLESWHQAAAEGFRDGVPEPRQPPAAAAPSR